MTNADPKAGAKHHADETAQAPAGAVARFPDDGGFRVIAEQNGQVGQAKPLAERLPHVQAIDCLILFNARYATDPLGIIEGAREAQHDAGGRNANRWPAMAQARDRKITSALPALSIGVSSTAPVTRPPGAIAALLTLVLPTSRAITRAFIIGLADPPASGRPAALHGFHFGLTEIHQDLVEKCAGALSAQTREKGCDG